MYIKLGKDHPLYRTNIKKSHKLFIAQQHRVYTFETEEKANVALAHSLQWDPS